MQQKAILFFIPSGLYKEKIIIDKSINLIGENKKTTIICGWEEKPNNNVITVIAENVTIANFSITSDGYLGSTDKTWRAASGISIKSSANCTIHDNLFYELGGWSGGFNIMTLNSNNTTIYNNNINGSGEATSSSGTGNGIIMDNCNNSKIYKNNVYQNHQYGIWISLCCNSNISQNTISKNNFGINVIKAHNNTVFRNTFIKNEMKGICVKFADDNIITRNNFIKDTSNNELVLMVFLNELFSTMSGEITGVQNRIVQCRMDDTSNIQIDVMIDSTYHEMITINESAYFKNTILDVIFGGLNLIKYYNANFFYSTGNNWDYNFWNEACEPPRVIYGKLDEKKIILHSKNYDCHPMQEPYEP